MLRAEAMWSEDREQLRQDHDGLEKGGGSRHEKLEILSMALVSDLMEMVNADYLNGNQHMVVNPVTVAGEILQPFSSMDFLKDIFEEETGPEGSLAENGYEGPRPI